MFTHWLTLVVDESTTTVVKSSFFEFGQLTDEPPYGRIHSHKFFRFSISTSGYYKFDVVVQTDDARIPDKWIVEVMKLGESTVIYLVE